MKKAIQLKNKTRYRFIALLLLVALFSAPIIDFWFARPYRMDAGMRFVKAEDIGERFTIRFYAFIIAPEAAAMTNGINGAKYSVTLYQSQSTDLPVGLSLYYNNIEGVVFFSAAPGVMDITPGKNYLEFTRNDFRSFDFWVLEWYGEQFFAGGERFIFQPSRNGNFQIDEWTEEINMMSSVFDANDSPVYTIPGNMVVDAWGNPIVDIDDNWGTTFTFYEDGEFFNNSGNEITVTEPLSTPPLETAPMSAAGQSEVVPMSSVAQTALTDHEYRRYLLNESYKAYANPKGITLRTEIYVISVKETITKPIGEDKRDADGNYTVLALLTERDMTFWERQFVKPFNPKINWVWYNLRGHEIDVSAYEKFEPEVETVPFRNFDKMNFGQKIVHLTRTPGWLLLQIIADRLEIVPVASGTIDGYMTEILQKDEPFFIDHPAQDLSTGDQLYDAAGSVISIGPTVGDKGGQLYDAAGWPLFNSYGMPCYYSESYGYYSVDKSFERYGMIVNAEKQLVDNKGNVIRTSIDNLYNEETMWYYRDVTGKEIFAGHMLYIDGKYVNVDPVTNTPFPPGTIVDAKPLPGDSADPGRPDSPSNQDLWQKILNALYIAALVIIGASLLFLIVWGVIKLIQLCR